MAKFEKVENKWYFKCSHCGHKVHTDEESYRFAKCESCGQGYYKHWTSYTQIHRREDVTV